MCVCACGVYVVQLGVKGSPLEAILHCVGLIFLLSLLTPAPHPPLWPHDPSTCKAAANSTAERKKAVEVRDIYVIGSGWGYMCMWAELEQCIRICTCWELKLRLCLK